MDPEREQEEIMLNTAALVNLTHHFLPGMLGRKDGIVVNVASMAAFAPILLFTVSFQSIRVIFHRSAMGGNPRTRCISHSYFSNSED